MAEIGFSRPEGRVRIHFPDEMSLDDLASTVALHVAICNAAKDKTHNPPDTGRKKSHLMEGGT